MKLPCVLRKITRCHSKRSRLNGFEAFLKSKKGTSMAMFGVIVFIILGFASISIDVGMIAGEKAKLANAADAAALAAAQELVRNSGSAVDVAEQYLLKNEVDPDNAQINVSEDGKSVNVSVHKEVDYFFAKALGFNKGEAKGYAEARVMPVTAVSSEVRPFAIEDQTLSFGQQYILKEGGGSGSHGNYGALALGGNGASNYRDNIIYGYNGDIKIGDYVDTEPGNMSGPTKAGVDALISTCNHCPYCTFDSFQPDCPRIITVLIVDSLDIHGRKSVKVVGFASFFLEGVDGCGNESIIRGRFVKTLTCGEVSDEQTDYGLRGIKLVR